MPVLSAGYVSGAIVAYWQQGRSGYGVFNPYTGQYVHGWLSSKAFATVPALI